MENTTIEKLSEAVSQLMDAYEELQSKYSDLANLKNNIEELENKKKDLEGNIDNLSSNKEQQSSKMNTMLNKIESILTTPITQTFNFESQEKEKEKEIKPIEIKSEDTLLDTNENEIPDLKDINIKKDDSNVADLTTTTEPKNTSDAAKIDLGRMESLLKGM